MSVVVIIEIEKKIKERAALKHLKMLKNINSKHFNLKIWLTLINRIN